MLVTGVVTEDSIMDGVVGGKIVTNTPCYRTD